MKKGAVAMIDALGFRGIWDRWPPEDILANMYTMKDRLEQDLSEIATQPDMQFDATFLSDTIVLGLALPSTVPARAALSLIYVGDILTRILAWSARSSTPLAYRGAIAYGEYEIGSHFVMGRAIDEAASYHESAEGAIVWLLPDAKSLVGDWLHSQPRNTHLVRHPVPLKGGKSFQTYTVSPIVQARDQDDARALVGSILATFKGPNVDVAVKRQNTVEHLRSCYQWRGWPFPEGVDPFNDVDNR